MLRHAEHRDLRIVMICKAIQRIANCLCHIVSVRLFGRPDLTGKHALCLDFACGLRDAVPGHDLDRDRHACGNRLCIREFCLVRLPDGLFIACRPLRRVSVSGSCEARPAFACRLSGDKEKFYVLHTVFTSFFNISFLTAFSCDLSGVCFMGIVLLPDPRKLHTEHSERSQTYSAA